MNNVLFFEKKGKGGKCLDILILLISRHTLKKNLSPINHMVLDFKVSYNQAHTNMVHINTTHLHIIFIYNRNNGILTNS